MQAKKMSHVIHDSNFLSGRSVQWEPTAGTRRLGRQPSADPKRRSVVDSLEPLVEARHNGQLDVYK